MDDLNTDTRLGILQSLPDWKRVVFMAACCERMLPNYKSFNSETGYGDPEILRRALDKVWRWVEMNELPADVSFLVQECDHQAPSTVDFSSIYTSAALDAANSISITIEAMEDNSELKCVEVASLATDTIDLFVQQRSSLDPNSPDFERKIREDPYMRTELDAQLKSVERLASSIEERSILVATVRAEFSGRSLPAS